jgi:bile acid-coenzyme A ligase
MSSGGSTGRPKIIVDHQPAEIDLERPLTAMSVGMTPEMVVLIPGPLYHNAPFLFATQALAIGCPVVGMDRFDPEEFLRLVQAFRVNWVQVVPTMMHRIWSLPRAVRERYDVSSLQVVWHMAAPCPPWLKEAWIGWLGAERILELYGGTERIGSTVIRGDEWLRKPGSVGRSHGRVRALAADGSDCAPGEVGELHFRLTGSGERPYHYIGDEVSRIRGDWESLGDLGWLDEDGYVFLADRRTDLILRGGANIYPAEVEAAIEAHPGIASSAVVGLPDPDLGQRVHAIVQPGDDGLELADLHRFLKGRLAPYKLPQSYEFWSEPLRDDAGKVRRSGLRDERIVWMESRLPFQTWIDEEQA